MIKEEQIKAFELLAESASILYSKSIETSGSIEMARDIVAEYFKAMFYGVEKPKWML